MLVRIGTGTMLVLAVVMVLVMVLVLLTVLVMVLAVVMVLVRMLVVVVGDRMELHRQLFRRLEGLLRIEPAALRCKTSAERLRSLHGHRQPRRSVRAIRRMTKPPAGRGERLAPHGVGYGKKQG